MTLYDKIKAQRVSPDVQPKKGRPALVLSDAEKIARYEKQKEIKLKSQRQYRMMAIHKAEAAQFDQAIAFISEVYIRCLVKDSTYPMITEETYLELKSILHDTAGVTWDSQQNMKYLDAVIFLVEEYENQFLSKESD